MKILLKSSTKITFIALFAACCSFFLYTCRQKKNLSGALKNAKVVSQKAKELIISHSFTRAEDRKSGVLTIKSSQKINCEITFWTNKTQNHPQTQACSEDKGATDLAETLKNLPINENLNIKVYTWPVAQKKDDKRYFEEKENADFSDVISKELIISRVVLPLKSTEIYQHNLETFTKIPDITKSITPTLGCSAEKIDIINPYPTSTQKISINNLSTSGFATGTATSHPIDPNRYQLTFDLLQMNQNWTWRFLYSQTEHEIILRAPGYLNNLKLNINNQEFPMKNKDLLTLEGEIPLNINDINMTWEPQNLTANDISFVWVSIKGLSNKKAITCVFSASDKTGTIPQSQISTLLPDSYDILVVLQTTQLIKPEDGESPTWLVSTQDWRFASAKL